MNKISIFEISKLHLQTDFTHVLNIFFIKVQFLTAKKELWGIGVVLGPKKALPLIKVIIW